MKNTLGDISGLQDIFGDTQKVRRLERNPEIGAYRAMAALEQNGIKLSQRICPCSQTHHFCDSVEFI
jgi:hypothetical protein